MALLTASGVCALIVLDTNIVAVALPRIARDLHATFVDIEWVVSAYMLTFAAGLLPAGSLADKFGRKRTLLIGLCVFTLASLACGLATTALALNLARGVKGIGAALLLTSALATIAHAFHDEAERARAWAFWGGCMGLAMLLAPSLGGIISQLLGWRWVFLLNLPIGAVLARLVARHIQESRNTAPARLDLWGSALFCSSLFLLIWALIDANRIGWTALQTALRAGAGVSIFILFIVSQRVQTKPMVDLALFCNPRLVGALLAMAAYAGCAQVMMTLIPLHLQISLGFTAISSGAAMLPFALTMVIFPRIGIYLAQRFRACTVLALGLVLVGVGNLLSACAVSTTSYFPFAVAIAVTGSGAGLLNGDTQKNIMACVPRDLAGMASGLSTTTRFSAIVLSFGLLGGLLAYRTHIALEHALETDPSVAAAGALSNGSDTLVARLIAGDLTGALAGMDPAMQARLDPLARLAYADAFAWILAAAGIIALIGAAVVPALMTRTAR